MPINGYGSYEIGRSAKYKGNPSPKSGVFKSETKIREPDQASGDPGAYDPYKPSEVASESLSTFSRTSVPFGSSQKRDVNVSIYGAGNPGPGRYKPARAGDATLPITSSFKSGSTQRPTSVTKTPGSGTYDPDVGAVKPVIKNMGANMQGKFDRFRDEETMTEDVGPGAYESDQIGSLAGDMKELASRGSKKNPAFGSTTVQRALPLYGQETPAPGGYYPMEPREKEMRVSRRSKSPARSSSPKPARSASPKRLSRPASAASKS